MVAAAAAGVLLVGGCMNEEDKDINKPLPRMSQKEAERKAHSVTQSLTHSAGLEVDEKSISTDYTKCVGANDEVPEDGRFVLQYGARTPLAGEKHKHAIQKMREHLKEIGYKLQGYQETKGVNGSIILDASDPDSGFTLAVDGVPKRDEITLRLVTPCLLPPGAKQQQY